MRRLLPLAAHTDPVSDGELIDTYAYPRPHWVRANMVASLDGSAVLSGRSGGLSGPADKRVFATLRAGCDVVLVGAGTARAEGYRAPRAKAEHASVRAAAGLRPAPTLAVVSRGLDLDPSSALFGGGGERTVVITCGASDPLLRARLSEVADVVVVGEEIVDLDRALDQLVERGLGRVLCEGGPRLLADMVAAGRLDELCLTVSPRLVAGPGPSILAGPALLDPPQLALHQLLEEDGVLFARYLLAPT